MGTDDLLVLGQTMDSDTSKLILHFDYQKQIKDRRTELFFFIPDLLNLDPSFYEVERVFSEKENARIIRLSMKTNVDICFETPSFKRTIELNSREKILIWRHNHHSFTDLVNRTATLGFDILHATTSRDYGNMMIVARVEKPKQFI